MPGGRKWTAEEDSRGISLWKECEDLCKVAEILGRSPEAVSQRKSKVWGISRTPKGPKTRKEFFQTWSADLAYFIGFLISDGHLRKDGKVALLVQSGRSGKILLEDIQGLSGGSIYKEKEAYYLNVMGKEVVSKLHGWGIPLGKKSLCVSFPTVVPENLQDHLFRGIFDGDGCVTGCRRKDGNFIVEVSITSGSLTFLHQLKSRLESLLSISPVVSKDIKGDSHSLRFSMHEGITFLNWIYQREKGHLCLNWKKEDFLGFQEIRIQQRMQALDRIKYAARSKRFEDYPETPEGYSSFDPEIAESVVSIYSEAGGTVLDPFVGWGTRAEASLRLGRRYRGYEIVKSTHERVRHLLSERWEESDEWELFLDDGCGLFREKDESIDLIFSSPPYWCLETYGEAPTQLSRVTYEEYLRRMGCFFVRSFSVLKKHCFMILFLGSFRKGEIFYPIESDLNALARKSGFVLHDQFSTKEYRSQSSRNVYRNAKNRVMTMNREVVDVFCKAEVSEERQYRWTVEEDEFLRKNYNKYPRVKELAKEMDRGISTIHRRASELGLPRRTRTVSEE